MSFSAAYKGKDGKIYFYQGTADAGNFVRKAKKTDKVMNFLKSPESQKNTTSIQPYRPLSNTRVPIYSRESLSKGYKNYIDLTEGYKNSTFSPQLKGWEAEDFKGNKYLLRWKGKSLKRTPLRRIRVRRRDGVKQRYWMRHHI